MNWYYVKSGQQAGPVEEAQLEELFRTGQILAETLVWHEGMANWQPYREVRPAVPPMAGPEAAYDAPPLIGVPPGSVLCSSCGRPFPPTEVIRYEDKFVCALCKPSFFQRLREGASVGGSVPAGGLSQSDLLERDYEVDIGGCLERSWEMFKANPGNVMGSSALVFLALFAANAIPYLGILLSLIFTGPLMAGLWLFYLRKLRNQDAEISDAFSGFGPKFWQYVLVRLVPGLLVLAVLLCFGIIAAIVLASVGFFARGGSGHHFTPALFIPLGVGAFLAWAVVVYFQVCWFFAMPLVADKGLAFWPALELSRQVVKKHWWMTFLLLFVVGLLGICGFIACLVGVLVTGPVGFAALTCHYDKVFGGLTPEQI